MAVCQQSQILPLEFQNVTDIRHWGFDTKYALEEQYDFSGGLMLRLPHPLGTACDDICWRRIGHTTHGW